MVGLGDRLRPSTNAAFWWTATTRRNRSLINQRSVFHPLLTKRPETWTRSLPNEILAMFQKLNDEGRTIIMVTHEDEVAAHAKRVIRLRDGEIQVDEPIQRPRYLHR